MKKRYRLFATIAAMTLALGLLTYGVVAATTVNMTINSSISYTAVGVAFNLYAKGEVLASKPTGTVTHLTSSTDEVMTTVNVTDSSTASLDIPTKSFTYEKHWVVYTFTIENIGTNLIESVYVSASSTSSNIAVTQDSPAGNIAEGAKQSFRVYFELKDPYQSITGSDNVSVTLMIGEVTYEQTEAAYISPTSMIGFTSSTSGNTTTYTRGPETYIVETTTSGSDIITDHTFINGSRTTTYQTVAYGGTDVALVSLNVTGGGNNLEIILGSYIAAIGNGSSSAFSGITTPFTITLPSNLLAIRDGAFAGSSVREVVFTGNHLTTIGNSAFSGCANLYTIYLPEGLETIGAQAFLSSGLSSVTFPMTLTQIMPLAFYGCQQLTYAYFSATNWYLGGSFDLSLSIQNPADAANLLTQVDYAQEPWIRM